MAAVPPAAPTVYLHVGPPKTGTTYLQDVVWRNRALLQERGLTVPGRQQIDHFHAALDLRGLDFGGHRDPAVGGAWQLLVRRTSAASTPKALISHELFAGAEDGEIEAVVEALAPSALHVVYGARDLARQLPAVWQESLKNRGTRSYDRFLGAALAPRSHGLDRGFWRAQHPARALGRWAKQVPAERIHVVTLPQAGAAAATLWSRFCLAVDLDPQGFDLDVARANSSLTAAEAEVLRRLNKALPRGLDWPAYERIVKRRFNELAERSGAGARLTVPRRHQATVESFSADIVAELGASGYDVVGDLADLIPVDASFGPGTKPSAGRVTRTAVRMLADVLVEQDAAAGAAGRRARRLVQRVLDRTARR